jgi:hypothetical protein
VIAQRYLALVVSAISTAPLLLETARECNGYGSQPTQIKHYDSRSWTTAP